MLLNNAKAHGKLSNHSNECQTDEDEYMNINTALLHVIEILWKENKHLRNQVTQNESAIKSGAVISSHEVSRAGGYAAGTDSKNDSGAGRHSFGTAVSEASANYADVCKMNIQTKALAKTELKKKIRVESEAVPDAEMIEKDRKNLRSCKYCGLVHMFGSNNCKAFGKSCNTCKKMNHYSRVCRNRRKKYMFNGNHSKARNESCSNNGIADIQLKIEETKDVTDEIIVSKSSTGFLLREVFINVRVSL